MLGRTGRLHHCVSELEYNVSVVNMNLGPYIILAHAVHTSPTT